MSDAKIPARRTSWRIWPWGLIALVLFAGVVRGGVLWAQFGNLRQDPDKYRVFADNLLRWGVFSDEVRSDTFVEDEGDLPAPSAYRPPLYPYLLANINRGLRGIDLGRVAVFHWVLGMATVLFVYELGRSWQLGVMSYLAAGLVACDPILLQQSTLIMTETLAAFLTALALLAFTRYVQRPEAFNAALAGGVIGLATLCRPTYLPWIALAALVILLTNRVALRSRFVHAAALAFAAAIVLAPWGYRNYRDLGIISITTTHGGYTFWLGNNAEFYLHLRERKSLESFKPNKPGFMQSMGDYVPYEVREDEILYSDARDAVRKEPGMFAYACCYRLWQLVSPLPHPAAGGEGAARTVLRYAVAAWYLAVYFLAGFGLYAQRRQLAKAPWIWGFTLCFAFVCVHAFYWTNLRMRAPLIPFLALVAAAGGVHLAEPFIHANLLRRKNLRSC